MNMSPRIPVVDLEDGWRDVLAGGAKLKCIIDGSNVVHFVPDEYMHLYTYVPQSARSSSPLGFSRIRGGFFVRSLLVPI